MIGAVLVIFGTALASVVLLGIAAAVESLVKGPLTT
jgi:hypothetical protein